MNNNNKIISRPLFIFKISFLILLFWYSTEIFSGTTETGIQTTNITAQYIDVNGWTVLTPSIDTRTIYVSNSSGDDLNDWLSQSTPVKTIEKGKMLLRDWYPDWLLLKKGDIWVNETIWRIWVSGRSTIEPMVFSSYWSWARPLMKTNQANGSAIYTWSGPWWDYLAIVGLEFYAYTLDPNSPDYIIWAASYWWFYILNPVHSLLLEDNKFNFNGGAIQAYPSGTHQNVSIRRNIISNSYSIYGHAQWIYTYETNNLLIEENVFDHNGWNETVPNAHSTIFNRNMYLSEGHDTTIVRGNIDANGASGGMQLRTGWNTENNLFLQNPISIVYGASENKPWDVVGWVIKNNVILWARDISTQAQWTAIYIVSNNALSYTWSTNTHYNFGPSYISGLEVSGNIIAHNVLGSNNISAINLAGASGALFSNTSVHDNIVYNWSKPVFESPIDHRTYGFNIHVESPVNVSFYDNTIEQPNSWYVGGSNSNTWGITIRDNTYWSAEPKEPSGYNGWFMKNLLPNTDRADWGTNISWWVEYTGETGMKLLQKPYKDPNRSISTYMSSLGMTATYEAFIQKADMQSKDNWDPRFTANAVNNYIRDGFEIYDIIPTQFSFNSLTWQSLNTQVESNQITITWINTWSTISVVWWEYKIWTWSYTSTTWVVYSWNTVNVRQTTSSEKNKTVTTTLTIGTLTGTFTLTTFPIVESNKIGINIGGAADWMEERLYADIIKMSRDFVQPNTNGNGAISPVDTNGWPLSDTSFYAWAGIDQMNGIYSLSFSGKASVNGNTIGTISLIYDTGSNTSQGTFQYSATGSNYLFLNFLGTDRDGKMTAGSGVTNIKLMRPTYPGSTKSYEPNILFTKEIQDEIAKFSTIRFMDFLATNWSVQTNWSDRTFPSYASVQRHTPGDGWQGRGAPWEHAIILANQTKKDVWINIPARATDDYIRKVANLFLYGSDGVNPYTSTQQNPIYPPLDPTLRIYVEYSNEVWNSMFSQFTDNCKAASNELVNTKDPVTGVSSSPLNFDKSWNGVTWENRAQGFDWQKCQRYTVYRGAQISDIFRSVYGNNAMGIRIRPIFTSQLGNAQATLGVWLTFLFEYYNNGAGNFVTIPHPPSYYFYGAGGSAYWASKNQTLTNLDSFFADIGNTPAGWLQSLQADANLVTAMGLKRIAYEWGPSLDKTTSTGTNVMYEQAVKDPRMTDVIVNMHNSWSENEWDLLMYYNIVWDYQWGFTENIHNLDTPKLRAIDKLNSVKKVTNTFGILSPGTLSGSTPGMCNRGWGCNPLASWDNFTAPGTPTMHIIWAAYNFRVNTLWILNATLSVSNANNATIGVYIDGNLIGTQTASGITSTRLNLPPYTVTFSGSHGIIIRALTGSFTIDSISTDISPLPLPETPSSNGTGSISVPTPPFSWWWGGGWMTTDYCPNGDYSPSYYDGICGTNPVSTSSGSMNTTAPITTNTGAISTPSYNGGLFGSNPTISTYLFPSNERIPQKVASELNFVMSKIAQFLDKKAESNKVKKARYYKLVDDYILNRAQKTVSTREKRILNYLHIRLITVSKGILSKETSSSVIIKPN